MMRSFLAEAFLLFDYLLTGSRLPITYPTDKMVDLHKSKILYRNGQRNKRDSRMYFSSSMRKPSRSVSLEPTSSSHLECSRSSSFDSSLASVRDNDNNITSHLHGSSEQFLDSRDEYYGSFDSCNPSTDSKKSVNRRSSFDDRSLDISKISNTGTSRSILSTPASPLRSPFPRSSTPKKKSTRQRDLYRTAIINSARRSLYDPCRFHLRGITDKAYCQKSDKLSLLNHSCQTNDILHRNRLPHRYVQFTGPKKFVRSQSTAPRIRTSMRLPDRRSQSFSSSIHCKRSKLKLSLITPIYIRSNQSVHIEPGTGEMIVVTNVVLQSNGLSSEERQKDLNNLVMVKPALSNGKIMEDDGKQEQKSTQTVLVGKNMMIIERKTVLQRSKPNATVRTADVRKYDYICEGRLGPPTKRPHWEIVNAIFENGISVEKEIYHKTEKIILLFGKTGNNSNISNIANTSNQSMKFNRSVNQSNRIVTFDERIISTENSITIVRDTLIDARSDSNSVWDLKNGFFAEEKRSYDHQDVNIDGSLLFTPSTVSANESCKILPQKDLRKAMKDEIRLIRRVRRSKTPEELLERQKENKHEKQHGISNMENVESEKTQRSENHTDIQMRADDLLEEKNRSNAQREESNLKSLKDEQEKKENLPLLEKINRKKKEDLRRKVRNEEQQKVEYEKIHLKGEVEKEIKRKTGSTATEENKNKVIAVKLTDRNEAQGLEYKKDGKPQARGVESHVSKIEVPEALHKGERQLDRKSMQQVNDIDKNKSQELRTSTPSMGVESINPSPTTYFDALSRSFTTAKSSYSRSRESLNASKTILPNSVLSPCSSSDNKKTWTSSPMEQKSVKHPSITNLRADRLLSSSVGTISNKINSLNSSFTPEAISVRDAPPKFNRSCPASICMLETILNVPTDTSGSTSRVFTIVRPMVVIATINGKEYKLTTNFSILCNTETVDFRPTQLIFNGQTLWESTQDWKSDTLGAESSQVKTVAVQAIDYEDSPKNN